MLNAWRKHGRKKQFSREVLRASRWSKLPSSLTFLCKSEAAKTIFSREVYFRCGTLLFFVPSTKSQKLGVLTSPHSSTLEPPPRHAQSQKLHPNWTLRGPLVRLLEARPKSLQSHFQQGGQISALFVLGATQEIFYLQQTQNQTK